MVTGGGAMPLVQVTAMVVAPGRAAAVNGSYAPKAIEPPVTEQVAVTLADDVRLAVAVAANRALDISAAQPRIAIRLRLYI